jgi:hypothetical protein
MQIVTKDKIRKLFMLISNRVNGEYQGTIRVERVQSVPWVSDIYAGFQKSRPG